MVIMDIFTFLQMNSGLQWSIVSIVYMYTVCIVRWWNNTIKTKNAMKNDISTALLTVIESNYLNVHGVVAAK